MCASLLDASNWQLALNLASGALSNFVKHEELRLKIFSMDLYLCTHTHHHFHISIGSLNQRARYYRTLNTMTIAIKRKKSKPTRCFCQFIMFTSRNSMIVPQLKIPYWLCQNDHWLKIITVKCSLNHWITERMAFFQVSFMVWWGWMGK